VRQHLVPNPPLGRFVAAGFADESEPRFAFGPRQRRRQQQRERSAARESEPQRRRSRTGVRDSSS
jgi:hypothetical protein